MNRRKFLSSLGLAGAGAAAAIVPVATSPEVSEVQADVSDWRCAKCKAPTKIVGGVYLNSCGCSADFEKQTKDMVSRLSRKGMANMPRVRIDVSDEKRSSRKRRMR